MDKIQTGDALFFCNNGSTGFFLRFFTSSDWSHVGVAVRRREGRIVQRGGDLLIFEVNADKRRDAVTGERVTGAVLSSSEWVFSRYNVVACRFLSPRFRRPDLPEKTARFVERYRGTRLTSSMSSFVGVWLGMSPEKKPDELMCTDLVARYYEEVLGEEPSSLFGRGARETYTPESFAARSMDGPLFAGKEEVVFRRNGDLLGILLVPFLAVLALLIFFWMALNGSS